MTVCVLPNPRKPDALHVARRAAELLLGYGARTVFCIREDRREPAMEGVEYLDPAAAFSQADVLLTVGGDGTILHAAKESLAWQKPILGVNLGRTGFLATCEQSQLPEKLLRLVEGRYGLDERNLLTAEGESPDGAWRQTALNDIVIYRKDPLHTIDCSVWCDDSLVNRCRGDGVIVATPTGSTAYSLSAGGPILDAQVQGFVVTPICAHSLHSPPMVFSANRQITVQVDPGAQEACVSSDGTHQCELLPGHKVRVRQSDRCIRLVTFNEADQFQAIDRKLKGR